MHPIDSQLMEAAGAEASAAKPVVDDSLVSDVKTLIDNGKTYVEAELQFQKTRAEVAAVGSRSAAVYGLAALGLLHLALIALVVGLVMALAPVIGAWLATAAVTALLAVAAMLFALKARSHAGAVAAAFRGSDR